MNGKKGVPGVYFFSGILFFNSDVSYFVIIPIVTIIGSLSLSMCTDIWFSFSLTKQVPNWLNGLGV